MGAPSFGYGGGYPNFGGGYDNSYMSRRQPTSYQGPSSAPGADMPTPASAPSPNGNWWQIGNPNAGANSYFSNELRNRGYGGDLGSVLSKWNSFTQPGQAFDWAGSNPAVQWVMENLTRSGSTYGVNPAANGADPTQWTRAWQYGEARNPGMNPQGPMQNGVASGYGADWNPDSYFQGGAGAFVPPAGKSWDPARGGWF